MAADPQTTPTAFADRLLDWFDRHGRHDLPWQREPSPYRIWLSEIMLQQTRVEIVIPYYERFVAAFPDLASLAAAPLDAVLHLWTGLGYYARARNLHRTAAIVCAHHGGQLPDILETLTALPGIGRSTAGAILATAWQQRAAILDGNVKRVLARHRAIGGWPGAAEVSRRLWTLAEQLTPTERIGDYTQAIMDLGATLCTRTRPRCPGCPVASDCLARHQDAVTRYPGRKPSAALPVRQRLWLILRNGNGEVLLEQRPPSGLWGGLWSFPDCAPDADIDQLCAHLGCSVGRRRPGPAGRHVFTHFRLDYETQLVEVSLATAIAEAPTRRWIDPAAPGTLGLPAPIKKLLGNLG